MKKNSKHSASAEKKTASKARTTAGPKTTAAKPASSKKGTATTKAAPAKTPSAVKRTSSTEGKKKKTPTTVVALVDVGFGNRLFIRGDGPGLSWDRGAAMECVEPNRWEWQIDSATGAFPFKVLINDDQWSHGEDYQALPGERKEIWPEF